MKRPKIGFISSCSPDDRRASSGTCFRMAQALGDIGEVVWMPLRRSRLVRFMELMYITCCFAKGHYSRSHIWGRSCGRGALTPKCSTSATCCLHFGAEAGLPMQTLWASLSSMSLMPLLHRWWAIALQRFARQQRQSRPGH